MIRFKLAGDTPEKKLAHVESILRRMEKRLQETVVGIIPPSPIFHYCPKPDDDGIIMKFLVPSDGVLIRLCMAVNKYNTKSQTEFTINIWNSEQLRSKAFKTRRDYAIEDVDIEVKTGDAIIFKASNPEEVESIWVSILYQIEGPSEPLTYMIEQFDQLNEGILDA